MFNISVRVEILSIMIRIKYLVLKFESLKFIQRPPVCRLFIVSFVNRSFGYEKGYMNIDRNTLDGYYLHSNPIVLLSLFERVQSSKGGSPLCYSIFVSLKTQVYDTKSNVHGEYLRCSVLNPE